MRRETIPTPRENTLLRFKDEKVVEGLEKVQSEIVSWIESFEIKYPEVQEKKQRKRMLK